MSESQSKNNQQPTAPAAPEAAKQSNEEQVKEPLPPKDKPIDDGKESMANDMEALRGTKIGIVTPSIMDALIGGFISASQRPKTGENK